MDTERLKLDGQRFADAFHRELRRAIDAPTRVRRVAAERGHVDDVPRPSLAHVWQHCARHVQKAEDVRCKLTFNFDGARFLDGPEQTVARVIQENVDTPELFDASRGGVAGLFERLAGGVDSLLGLALVVALLARLRAPASIRTVTR